MYTTSKKNQVIELDSSYKNFIQSIRSEHTKTSYDRGLEYFMRFMNVDRCSKLLDDNKDPRIIQADIIDYILYLKNTKKLAPASISFYVAAITHFYVMNDINLNWKKINSFKGDFYDVIEDQPYTREQIKLMVDKAEPLRNRAIILLLASSGIRVGAIYNSKTKDYLKVGNLMPIDKYNIYQITIYKKSKKSKYITFCSNECRKEIDTYLQYRERYGEKITKDSPLFRREFDRTDQLDARNNIRPLSDYGIAWIVNKLLNITGIRISPKLTEGQTHNQRTSIMQRHGFRKFFDTTCTRDAGMNPVYTEMLMGHDIGLKGRYTKLTPEELLEGNDRNLGYLSAMEHLIICNENRLKIKVEELTEKRNEIQLMKESHEQEMRAMRQEMEKKFQELFTRIDVTKLS